jgi:hypothetical protein
MPPHQFGECIFIAVAGKASEQLAVRMLIRALRSHYCSEVSKDQVHLSCGHAHYPPFRALASQDKAVRLVDGPPVPAN